jgi:hypothetical protein
MDILAQFRKEVEQKKQAEMHNLLQELKDATPVDTGHARESWKIEGNKIVNDAEYIDDLNAGSSQQAPSHFIERTVLSHTGVKPNGTIVT